MIIRKSLLAAGITSLALLAPSAMAKVIAEEAATLNSELTPFGAQRAGNAEGTIPAWNPNFKVPASYKGAGTHYPDPYADDEVLFTVTAENMDQYADKLTPGLQAMFKTYPDTFKMNVYPSHRDVRYSSFIEQEVIKNASRAELVSGGNGVTNAFGGPAFPIPKEGVEAIWNTIMKPSPFYWSGVETQAVVYRNGNITFGRKATKTLSPLFDPNDNVDNFINEDKPRIHQMQQTLAPTRNKGEAALVKDWVNSGLKPRKAWSYMPGTRRVRRAPTVGYDSPGGLGNMQPVDAFLGFNGAPDRYNWTLVGKKEMYVPYNAYRFENTDVKYKELLTPGHVNPEHMRYELHRVWVVQGDLKDGERHVYKKRVLFMDEDSWWMVLADQYDNHDALWRTTAMNTMNLFDMPGAWGRSGLYHDLISREYLATALFNEEPEVPKINVEHKTVAFFSTGSLRKLGVR